LNPTKYTLNPDETEESAFAPPTAHREEEKDDHIDPSELMHSLKLGQKEKRKHRRNINGVI
jgi:hypothetical protein